MSRRRRFWWRRSRPGQGAYRCGHCGWYPPDPVNGRVYGRFDPRFVGHGRWCPEAVYKDLTTAAAVADQWWLLEMWARLAERLDTPGWDETWRHAMWALVRRADMLGVGIPIPDDAAELSRPSRDW